MASSSKSERRIIGIDPGTNFLGYGIIDAKGNSMVLIGMGTIQLSKLPNHAMKLKKIYERVSWLIDEFTPDELSIEAPFFGKNVQSMLKLGRAQGVAMTAGLVREIPIFEYSPKKIKQSITGKGAASKEQVAAMLQRLLKYKEQPTYLDATDGLAAAVCHFFQGYGTSSQKTQYKNWGDFVRKNQKK